MVADTCVPFINSHTLGGLEGNSRITAAIYDSIFTFRFNVPSLSIQLDVLHGLRHKAYSQFFAQVFQHFSHHQHISYLWKRVATKPNTMLQHVSTLCGSRWALHHLAWSECSLRLVSKSCFMQIYICSPLHESFISHYCFHTWQVKYTRKPALLLALCSMRNTA